MTAGQLYVDTTSGDLKYQGATGLFITLAKGDGTAKHILSPMSIPFSGISGLQSTGQSSADQKGAIIFDPSILFVGNSDVTRTIVFQAVLECALGGSTQTCSLELFNATDAASVATITTQQNTPTIVVSSTLAVGSGAGQLPNSQKLYILNLTRTGGTSTDLVSCKLARLLVSYA